MSEVNVAIRSECRVRDPAKVPEEVQSLGGDSELKGWSEGNNR